jgi:hypothetical protein
VEEGILVFVSANVYHIVGIYPARSWIESGTLGGHLAGFRQECF